MPLIDSVDYGLEGLRANAGKNFVRPSLCWLCPMVMRHSEILAGRSSCGRLSLAVWLSVVASVAPANHATAETPHYVDIAAVAGLHDPVTYGSPAKSTYILETTGTGVAVLDFDRDGDNDVFIVNGTTLALQASGDSPPSVLYINDGKGMFSKAAAETGLDTRGWGQGVCVGDIDNDGWEDLLVTYFGSNVLYRNRGGRFEDASSALGQPEGQRRWGSGCAFLDYDLDGLLDVFVANYVDFDPETTPKPGSNGGCEWKSIPVMCGPRGLPRALNALYRNLGNGEFQDVSDSAGILAPGGRFALGVVTADYDNDGDTDIYVACDMTPSLLYSNNGDGTFTDIASEAGVAYNGDGQLQAGMGVAVADYDGNGFLDIAKTNFSGDLPSLYKNEDGIFFEDVSFESGLGKHQLLGWGMLFLDMDEDGWSDLFLANGHVYPEVDTTSIGETYSQLTVLYRNLGNGSFEDVTEIAGPALEQPRPSRGMASGDLDGDGHPEVVIVNLNRPPTLLQNTAARAHAVLIELQGVASNRNAIGARVELTTGHRTQVQAVVGGGSYYSHSDRTLHFGIGREATVDAIDVTWPSGLSQRWTNLEINRHYRLVEGHEEFQSSPFKLDRERSKR